MTSQTATTDRPGIDERAPVKVGTEIEIAAPVETVWDVLAAIDRWPDWNPGVKSVSLDGSVAEGTQFRWKAGPGTITSVLLAVDEPRFIAWSGRTLGIDARHFYEFAPRETGTLVRTAESYGGLVSRIFRGPLTKTLTTALDEGLRCLKVEAERRASASA
jgi:uncharacterized protein YndB with AHSA1/START domain